MHAGSLRRDDAAAAAAAEAKWTTDSQARYGWPSSLLFAGRQRYQRIDFFIHDSLKTKEAVTAEPGRLHG